MNQRIQALKPYPMEALTARKAELHKLGKPVYDFGTGDPTVPTEPFIIDALRNSVPTISQYPTVAGDQQFRETCASYVKRRFGVTLDPESQILPTAGSKEAVFHFPLVFLDTDSNKTNVIYPTPGYPVYERGTLFANGTPCPVVLREDNGFVMNLDGVETQTLEKTAILWLNSPHNPTGSVMSRSQLQHMVTIARQYGIIICSDECYGDIYFQQAPTSILQCTTEGALAFFSLSKRSGMTGYRSGFIAGDATLIARYRVNRATMGVASPVFIQAAATAAWNDDEHVERRRKIFRERRDLIQDFLRRKGLAHAGGDGTFFLWVKVPAGYTDFTYTEKLLEHGIVVSPGSFFGQGSERYIRLALVPDLTRCHDALEVWNQIQ
ncbi:succinyldiaminopimelate transaminase [Desulfurispira natronophila]|uniref:Succinyldiaminopimelate transaminase n=1 Tax=Desulfurispira natronophila TaxID=682562 RepID=A0A7W7Y5K9_9BACT|nr:succinyldiaminopimelate transaminase [Desulfurispira natronophila]MBB5022474.1 succinyldiaminopimelate transaminase [Desulfurispira natronophila]